MIKGYPTQEKDERLLSQFGTVEPIREKQYGLSVNASVYVYSVGTDAVEANSTTYTIVATAHAARQGDIIRFTSGTHSGREVKVSSVSTNAIVLGETLSSAPAAAVTFQILRPKYPVVDSDGLLSVSTVSTPIQYVLDGVDTEVMKDTVTPANSRPLPVELVGVAGPINITAGDLNVALSHANDSVKIGDGTETANVNASNELQVADDTARTSLGTIAGAVSGTEMQVDVLTSALPTGAATSANQTTEIGHLATLAGAVSGTEMQVDVLTSALPTGASTLAEQQTQTTALQLIDDTVATVGAAIIAKGIAAVGTDGTDARILKTDASGELQIDVLSSALPTGAATSANQTTEIGHLATVAGAVSGTEMQVDVLTSALPTGAATSANQTTEIGHLATLAGAVSGTEVQVDVLTSALPTGASTLAEQQTQTTALQLIDDTVATVGAAIIAKGIAAVGTDGTNARVLKTDASGELQVDVLSSALPTGASTLAEQQTQTTSLQLLDDAVATTGAAITAKGFAAVGTDGTNARIVKTDSNGELQVDVLTMPAITPTYLDVVDFIDTNNLIDTSSTNIAGSGSSPTQIVASLAADVKKVQFMDTTGAFIGLYTGAAASEVLQAVFGPGSDVTTEVQLTSGQRVSLKRLDSATAISTGIVAINFCG